MKNPRLKKQAWRNRLLKMRRKQHAANSRKVNHWRRWKRKTRRMNYCEKIRIEYGERLDYFHSLYCKILLKKQYDTYSTGEISNIFFLFKE